MPSTYLPPIYNLTTYLPTNPPIYLNVVPTYQSTHLFKCSTYLPIHPYVIPTYLPNWHNFFSYMQKFD